MKKTLLHARESVAFDHELVIEDSNGTALDITGWTFDLVLARQAGSPDLTLGMAASSGDQGFEVVDGPAGALRMVIDQAELVGIGDTTGNFTMFGDLLGTPPGEDADFVADVRVMVTTAGNSYGGPTSKIAVDAAGSKWVVRVEALAAMVLVSAGPNHADTAEGLAATSEGDTFAVDNGDGTVTVYAHDAGSVATALRSFIKDHGTLIEVLGVPATVAAQVTAAQSAQSAAAVDAANALAARLLAEAARDAVLAANVYPDTTAGLAAVAEGEYFFVAGAGNTLLTLYRDVAGVATSIGTMASGAAVSGLLGGASASDQLLKEWTEAEAYRGVFATPDQLAAASTAAITWPDGSTGTFTITAWNATFGVPDAWTATHVLSGRKVTQTAITRTAKGNPSARPALTVGAI